MRRERQTHPRVFELTLILGAVGMLAIAAALGAAIGSVHHAPDGAGRIGVAGLELSYPRLNASEWLLVGLAALGTAAIAVGGRATWRQRRAYRGFLDTLEVTGRLDGHPTVRVIAGARPEAFCAGFVRPAVYISEGALELLSGPQLEAVLAHEYHHRLLRDPLRFAFGRILSQALFFVPVMRPLRDRYADLAEVNADCAAVRSSAGSHGPLASALLLFDAGAPPGASGISPERVDSLLGQPADWRVPLSLLAASIAALTAIGGLIWLTSGVASARATFNLPFLSSQPCVVVMTVLPVLGFIAVVARRARARQIDSRRA